MATIESKAWKVFSSYIRMRDATDLLLVECITCPSVGFYSDFDCGHYIRRGKKSVMYSEMNNHAQCRKCNRELDGNTEVYREVLVDRYGEEAVLLLERESKEMKAPDHAKVLAAYKIRLKRYKHNRFRHIFFPDRVVPTKTGHYSKQYWE